MYESLLDFTEENLFSRIQKIKAEDGKLNDKIEKIGLLVLGFCQKNPGISRLLTGEVLLGETQRLKDRIGQIFDRIELEIKQIHRDNAIEEGLSAQDSAAVAKFVSSLIEGKLQQFVRSRFKIDPLQHWNVQWRFATDGII
jgi:TetR/AcrR family transcriptional regulator